MEKTFLQKVGRFLIGCLFSRTMWWNVINLALLSLEIYFEQYAIDPRLHGTIIGIGNLILRSITTKPVSDK